MPSLYQDTAVPEFYDNEGGVRTKVNLVTSNITTKTGAYTLTAADGIVLCDASGGVFTITLPPASSNIMYSIKKIDSSGNIVTIDADGSETIDGDLTVSLDAEGESITLVTDGSNWFII